MHGSGEDKHQPKPPSPSESMQAAQPPGPSWLYSAEAPSLSSAHLGAEPQSRQCVQLPKERVLLCMAIAAITAAAPLLLPIDHAQPQHMHVAAELHEALQQDIPSVWMSLGEEDVVGQAVVVPHDVLQVALTLLPHVLREVHPHDPERLQARVCHEAGGICGLGEHMDPHMRHGSHGRLAEDGAEQAGHGGSVLVVVGKDDVERGRRARGWGAIVIGGRLCMVVILLEGKNVYSYRKGMTSLHGHDSVVFHLSVTDGVWHQP